MASIRRRLVESWFDWLLLKFWDAVYFAVLTAVAGVGTALLGHWQVLSPIWVDRGWTAIVIAVAIVVMTVITGLVRRKWSTIARRPDGPFQIEIVDANGQHPIPIPIPTTAEEWTAYQLKPVANQRYVRENVLLDGKNYIDCDFEQVTFWYDGTAPFALTDCRLDEQSRRALHTRSPALTQWMAIANTFGLLRPDIKLGITPLRQDRVP